MKKLLYILLAVGGISFTISCSKDYGYNFENGFDIGNIDDSLGLVIDRDGRLIDKSKYTQARIFPGLIGEGEPRLNNVKVPIDLSYVNIKASDLRISVAPGNWQSTGMYAPAGELITIEVPAGVYGLTAQIGAHVATSADGIEVPQRDLVIYNQQVLFPGKNYMRNLYGGLLYILPSAPLGKVVELDFSGVAKAPSFKLGVTDPVEWQEMIKNSKVPWFELEGNRIVFTLETKKAQTYGIKDPKILAETWDKAIKEGYWDWTGLTEGNPNPKHRAPFNKWRIVHDVLFKPSVLQVSGYPVRARNTESYFRQATTLEEIMYRNWGTYHELGHNMQQNSVWNVAGGDQMGEVTNNLFNFSVSHVFGQQSYKIKEVWDKGMAQQFIGSGTKWSEMSASFPTHLDIKLIFYAQIFEKYGYDFMTYLSKRARDARFTSANDQSRYDFFYEALCEFTKIDMLPFVEAWGWSISNVSKEYVQNNLGYPMLDRKVWLFNPVTRTGGDELNIEYVHLDKASWTITANSWDTRTGASYRPAMHMIDGDNVTIWHPCVSGCNTTDNKSSTTIGATGNYEFVITTPGVSAKGFTWVQRSGTGNEQNNHPKKVTVLISDNGTDYSTLGTYDLNYGIDFRSGQQQIIHFNANNSSPAKSFKYIKLLVNRQDVSDTNAAIAEFGLVNF